MKLCINRIILCVLLVARGVCTSLGAMGLESHDEKSIDCCDQFNYSINLMWINRDVSKQQLFIHPSNDINSLMQNFLNSIFQWASLNKSAVVNVWYDGAFISDIAIENTQRIIREYGEKSMAPIFLRDVSDLPKVVENKVVFSEKTPVFFRADLLRVMAALHVLKNAKKTIYFVHTDLDIDALRMKDLFDVETLKNLQTYGFVMAKGGAVAGCLGTARYENSFQIISNNNENLLAAISLVLVDVNIERAKNALRGQFFGNHKECVMKRLLESVYDSYRGMLIYWRSLEGKKDGWRLFFSEKREYDEKVHGLKVFGLKHALASSWFLRLVRESKYPLVTWFMNIFYDEEEPDLRIPVKDVHVPPTQIKLYKDALFDSSHPKYVAQKGEDPFNRDNLETW